MCFQARNGTLALGDRTMDFIRFGRGERPLVMIPGLGDGLRTVKGTAAVMAVTYRALARERTVYMFSRVNELTEGHSTRDMAEDLAAAMGRLGIAGADVIGVSQGGMAAQWLAILHPELVDRLVLTVTAPRADPRIRECVGRWIGMARAGDYKSLMIDTAERTYTEGYLRKRRWIYPLLIRFGRPGDFSRFIIQAEACMSHDAAARLTDIRCPTLVIGAGEDQIVGVRGSEELAAAIRGSELYVYEGYGHGVYEEAAGDWLERIRAFLHEEERV